MNRLYNVGGYVRLSVESAAYDSDSVENQKTMLSKFIAVMPGWVETKFYVDDGATGGNFDRAGFQEMISDARNGVINLVLVKDLSRFGRNYLEAGHYLEDVLPSLGCRFVSMDENIDTDGGENDIVPFLNAMNDYYLKNLSDRIRSVLAAKAKAGQKIGRPSYGFRYCKDNNNKLVIDEYSSGIVRRIFDMRKQGVGSYTIAKELNAEGVLPPMQYYLSTVGRDDSHIKTRSWQPSKIIRLLQNEAYIGTAVQFVSKVVSYRDKRKTLRPVDEQIRVEGAFPAIIDSETWDAVQEVNKKAGERYINRHEPEKPLFSEILFCGDCGTAMNLHRDRHNEKKYGKSYCITYFCRRYSTTAAAECTRHGISEASLVKLLSAQITQMIERVQLDRNAVIQSLTEKLIGNVNADKAKRKQELSALQKRIHKLEFTITKLYEDRVAGVLSEDTFKSLIQKNETERQECEKRLAMLESSEQVTTMKLGDIETWVRLINEKTTFKDVDRDLLDALIERIEVGKSRRVNGVKVRDVRIFYKFVGALPDNWVEVISL